MSSPAQNAANGANAQHSTGPRTETGKATSSQNSLKHGLTAKTILLPGEDEAAYRQMCEGMFKSFAPACTPENTLVQLLCDTQWRIERCGRLEATILCSEIFDHKGLDSISKHEARLKRQYSTTLKEACAMIDARLKKERADMKDAMTVRRADKLRKVQGDYIHDIGFVFSTEEVDAAIYREDTIKCCGQALVHDRLSKRQGYGLAADTQKKAS